VTRLSAARSPERDRSDHANVYPAERVPRLQRVHGAAQAAERSPVAFIADGEFVAPFGASGSEDFPPIFRCHPRPESVCCATAAATGLVRALHAEQCMVCGTNMTQKYRTQPSRPRRWRASCAATAARRPPRGWCRWLPQFDGSANGEHFLCVLADRLWGIQLCG